jgi:hypothetical protein
MVYPSDAALIIFFAICLPVLWSFNVSPPSKAAVFSRPLSIHSSKSHLKNTQRTPFEEIKHEDISLDLFNLEWEDVHKNKPHRLTIQLNSALHGGHPKIRKTRRFKFYEQYYPILGALVNATLDKIVSKLDIVDPNGVKINKIYDFDNYLDEFHGSQIAEDAKRSLAKRSAEIFNLAGNEVNNYLGLLSVLQLMPNHAKIIEKKECFRAISKIYGVDNFEFDVLLKCLLYRFSDRSVIHLDDDCMIHSDGVPDTQ